MIAQFSRPVGVPLYGKRTVRPKISMSPLTKDLADKEAKRLGLSFSEFADQLISIRVHGLVHVAEDTETRLRRVVGNWVTK
jgi:hypothetical protein